ncbi:DUF4974 domain-containing protein [Pedobacter hiemivivus]|uniref:DUF4974 domain-containing protein n=1 Tax=Pedobacter hiemivivus TaxID=2530454 RepID=A0A4U1G7F5_9SPHI|nr:FecR family protein [Pedobacter hiemivivus]TKC58503.1 DUF4974 domain-containing protein [Pedobacter hiemivivus]
MAPERFKALLAAYYSGSISADDRKELNSLLHDNTSYNNLQELITESVSDADLEEHFAPETLEMVYQRIKQENSLHQEGLGLTVVRNKRYTWIAAAAAIFIFLSVGIYINHLKQTSTATDHYIAKSTIHPGTNKAILTLSDGKKIFLDDMHKGKIAQQSGIVIEKMKSGELNYVASSTSEQAADKALTYNTINIPRGGQYQVNLPDGTKVWLNAASALVYPVIFKGTERLVKLTGEAYFEVAKNKSKPFKVATANQTIEVLGTHFNVNAYADETSVNTTLLEGSVKIILSSSALSQVISPGQQARVNTKINVYPVDTEEAVAWKNGLFMFNKETIQSVMRQISRWYDVEVEYKGEIAAKGFWGTIPRDKDLTYVLKVLEETGVAHFKLIGRRIVVMP